MTNFYATAIIPPELYVRRSADDQLKQAVEEMGRPPYVLVARQMGKTNLLLNMKREREAVGDIVYYVDLSQRYDTIQSLFRSIIDGICEIDLHLDEAVYPQVLMQRAKLTLEPTTEYERHIRLLLRNCQNRKIIIIFDEVDSLISVFYSDMLFAQIRSMYFSRTNFREYYRLTYVLSGVAEPLDLIKDKNISPFNIGEKIYLDPFSRDQVTELASKSSGNYPVDVVDRIYHWTAGNPRMTWDVFTDISTQNLDTSLLTPGSVDASIDKLFLNRFDRAPIDNIRSLVENDPELRSGVISLHRNEPNTITPNTIDRLYLAGIANAISGENIQFSSEVVRAAVSENWLNLTSKDNFSLTEAATESFNKNRYLRTISLLDEFKSKIDDQNKFGFQQHTQLGMSYYYLQEYADAVDPLLAAIDSAPAPEQRAIGQFYLASSLFHQNDLETARRNFEAAAVYSGPLQRSARMGIISTYTAEDTVNAYRVASKLASELIDDLSAEISKGALDDAGIEILAAAYASLYQAHKALGSNALAQAYLETALDIAPDNMKPALAIMRIEASSSSEIYSDLIVNIAQLILDKKLKFNASPNSYLNFDAPYLALVIEHCMRARMYDLARLLIEYAAQKIYYPPKTPLSAVVSLLKAIESSGGNFCFRTALYATEHLFDDSASLHLKVYVARYLAEHSGAEHMNRAFKLYLNLVERAEEVNYEFSDDDYSVIFGYTQHLIEQKEFVEAIAVAKLGQRIIPSNISDFITYTVMLRFHEFSAHQSLGNGDIAKFIGSSVINEIDRSLNTKNDLTSNVRSALALVKQRVSEAISTPLFPQIRLPESEPLAKFGRNERLTVRNVKTGETFTTKYKRISDGLKSGDFVVLSSNKSRQ